jgi:hypothetical protein
MASSTLPKTPVENWERVRDEWVAAVEGLIGDAETWSHKQDWATRRDAKPIVEDRLGPYIVPQLLIQGTFGRLLLDPVARYIVGAEGLVDLFLIPSYDSLMIARYPEGWFLVPEDAEGPRVPWSEASFVEAALRLARSA